MGKRLVKGRMNIIKRAVLIPLSAVILTCSPMAHGITKSTSGAKKVLVYRKAMIESLLKRIKKGDMRDGIKAALELGKLKDKQLTKRLMKLAKKEKNPEVLEAIVVALGEIKDLRACTLLMIIAEGYEKSLYVNWQAIKALEKIGGWKAYDALIHIGLNAEHKIIREPAIEAMERVSLAALKRN